MDNYRWRTPALSWNGNMITLAGPLEGPRAYPVPRAGSVVEELDNGERDGACDGVEYYLDAIVPYIPGETVTSGPEAGATGWDASNGWAAFLSWAWSWAPFHLLPVAGGSVRYACVLVAPDVGDFPDVEDDGSRALALRVRSPYRLPFLGY